MALHPALVARPVRQHRPPVWQCTEEVLLQHGSWKEPKTVLRFYSGITDQTFAWDAAIHGWGP
jgi:hypothetical protein